MAKIYDCQVCGQQFRTKYHIKAHLKTHPSSSFCDTCFVALGENETLESHNAQYHQQESPKRRTSVRRSKKIKAEASADQKEQRSSPKSSLKKESSWVNLDEASHTLLKNKTEQSDILPQQLAKEDEMPSHIKSFCTRYEEQGKDVLVLVAEHNQCRWFGTQVASQCITDLYPLVFKFFSLCQESRASKKRGTKITVRLSENTNNNSADTTGLNDHVEKQPEGYQDETGGENGVGDVDDSLNDLTGLVGEFEVNDLNTENPSYKPNHSQEENLEDNGTDRKVEKTEDLNGIADKDERVIGDNLEGKTKTSPHSCSLCDSKFIHEAHLQTHTQKVTNCDTINHQPISTSYNNALKQEVTYDDLDTGNKITTTLSDVLDCHKATDALSCLICGKSFKLKIKLRWHTLQHNKTPLYRCNICGDHFTWRGSLVYHTRRHFRKPYECGYCPRKFQTESECSEHAELFCTSRRLLEHDENGPQESLQCDKCNFKTPNEILMTAHQTSHSGPALCVCTLCGKQLKKMSSLNRHMLTVHSDTRPYPCPVCHVKSFKSQGCLNRHVMTHGERSHVCEICDKGFKDRGNLTAHMKVHSDARPYVCDFCGVDFRKKLQLDNHRRIHTGDTPYSCDFEGCSKAFRSKDCLIQHKRTHEQTKLYICDVCGRRFKQPGSLRHHRKSHTDEWRWSCSYCPNPQRFNSLWRFKRHLAQQHPDMKEEIEKTLNIKLHQCNVCGKVYHDSEDFTRHQNNHNGIRPYQCTICDKSYSDRSNRNAHMLTHSGGKKYGCHVCHKRFLYNKNLLEHVQRKHPREVGTMFVPARPYTTSHPPTLNAPLTIQQPLAIQQPLTMQQPLTIQQPGLTNQQEYELELTPLQILE